MTARQGPYLRLQVGGVTLTVRSRPAWARIGRRVAVSVPVGLLIGAIGGLLGRPPWW